METKGQSHSPKKLSKEYNRLFCLVDRAKQAIVRIVYSISKRLNKNSLLISLLVSILLIASDYFIANMKYPIFDVSNVLSKYAYALESDNIFNDSDLFTVNIAYDKELATTIDVFGDTIGETPVTDRAVLCQFLDVLSQSHYRYVFIDIRFDSNLSTANDSALYKRIAALPRLVISNHASDDFEIADSLLLNKAAYADLYGALNGSFSRYNFFQNNQESVALHLYRNIDNKGITQHSHIYTDDGHLCYANQFLPLLNGQVRLMRHRYLGAELLKLPADSLASLMNNKIVIVGDFENDTHSTYVGEVPGPILNYYAYCYLSSGMHKVKVEVCALEFLFFFLICYFIVSGKSFIKTKSIWVSVITSLLGWNFFICLLQFLIYIIFKRSFSSVIPQFIFSLIIPISTIYKYHKRQTHKI